MPFNDTPTTTLETDYDVRVPRTPGLGQDEEWCEILDEGGARRIRFHDYDAIYSVPGLYERLFYEELHCHSPQVVRAMLEIELCKRDADPEDLTVLDLGAGNGMVGEELARLGADSLIGVDILEEAAEAAERDRPGLYDEYLVCDLAHPPADARAQLEATPFTCLTSVAALGFGDIPPEAFAAAHNYVERGAMVAFTIKEDFLSDGERSGFAGLVGRMLDEDILRVLREETYPHRLSAAGEWLPYRAIVAEKRDDVPDGWLAD